MRAWVAIPAAAIAMGAALLAGSVDTGVRLDAAATRGFIEVRIAVAEPAGVMTDACVFSAEAMAAGAPAQCGDARVVHAVAVVGDAAPPAAAAEAPLEWPGDFFSLTIEAALSAWDATIGFLGTLIDYAGKAGGLDI